MTGNVNPAWANSYELWTVQTSPASYSTMEVIDPRSRLMASTGVQIGKALGLRWCDVDFDAGLLRVRLQLSRHR